MYVPIRRMLLALVLVGTVGLALELVLLEHAESVWQSIPFVMLGGGFVSGITVWVKPTRRAIHVFRAAMALCIAAGLLGLYLHYRGNLAFELELDPSAQGLDLVWRALTGATPALAPAALAQLGLLGLIQAYRHPALSPPSAVPEEEFTAHTTRERRHP